MEFQKIQGGFGNNVRNNRFANNLDYENVFDSLQMTITLCSVPYDVGEIHIGNRSISGRGNVVGWESEQQRDSYFAEKTDKYVFQTKFRAFHTEDVITLPVPFYAITKYNYIIVEHEPFPTEYGDSGEVRKFFYFVRDMKMKAPNTTEVTIIRDDWTTYICRCDFTQFSMIRGHYAVANTDVESYLSNPLENNAFLLDESGFSPERNNVSHTEGIVFNEGEQLFICAFKCEPWQTEDTALSHTTYRSESAFNIQLVAFAQEDAAAAVAWMKPVIYRALLWCAFVPSSMVTKGEETELFGYTCWKIADNHMSLEKSENLIQLDRDMFGYDAHYADLAKLYTFPFATLMIYDEKGNANTVRIEDTAGTIVCQTALLSMLGSLDINCILDGIGSVSSEITVSSIGNRSINIGGKWYATLFNWSVPTFAVVQSAYRSNEIDTLSDRQARSATTAETNSASSDNTATSNAANTAKTAVANASISYITGQDNALMGYTNDVANLIVYGTATSTIEAANQQGSISNISNFFAGAYAVSDAYMPYQTGDGIASAISNVMNTFAAGSNSASLAITNGQTALQAGYTELQNNSVTSHTQQCNANKANNSRDVNDDVTEIANGAASAMTARSNSAATYNSNALNNNILENGYRIEPPAYGIEGDTALKPYGIWCSIETASRDDIRKAGDDFLRYGYPMSGVIEFETFNVMPKFSYWQIDDMWIKPSGLSDRALDGIRFLLMGGVTVWNPAAIDDIGRITIYENV